MRLHLRYNKIGSEGTEFLANALQLNAVRTFCVPPSLIHYFYCTQTLTTLILEDNRIGEEGARHLANALQTNMVRWFFQISIIYIDSSILTDTHNTKSCRK